MKPSLQLKLGQQLTLTPQLQQSIRLLQMSTLELSHELEGILAENPLLERLDDPFDGSVRIDAGGGLDASKAEPGEFVPGGDDAAKDGAEGAGEGDSDRGNDEVYGDNSGDETFQGPDEGGDDRFSDWSSGSGSGSGEASDSDERPELGGLDESLREHLLAQLATTNASPRDRALTECLIDSLDGDGLLDNDLEELLEMLPPELAVESEELRTALRLLQSFDPPGVGARDLRESLLLQIDARAREAEDARLHADPAAPRDLAQPEYLGVAREIVARYLPELAAGNFSKLSRALHCDEETLRAAQSFIRTLSPRPGSAYAAERPVYIVPDLIVRRGRSGWTVTLNEEVIPKLRINEVYAQVLKQHRGTQSAMSGQLQEARWLIKNVHQRFETILRVGEAIVERQSAFFTHGAIAMKPMVLREIAEILELHESTVSRVTTHKFMLTPLGTFELKYFFGSHVGTEGGGTASSTAIRALIQELIAAENPARPLADGQIADLLGEQGFVVARRTVAKYREALLIPPVAQRKVL